jgi:hypothetical protein
MKHIKKFSNISENYGGEEAHKDDFGTTGWDAIKQKLYVGSREEDESIDWVIELMKYQGYSVPSKEEVKKPISTAKGNYPGPTNL